MDSAKWEREYVAQTDYLAMQLRALDKQPLQRRKRFINHEIRCSGCGDVLVQVVALDPYRVVKYRSVQPDRDLLPADPRERLAALEKHQRSIRLEKNWMFFPIADDELGSDHQLVAAACRCTRQRTFTLRGILGRRGHKSTSRPNTPT